LDTLGINVECSVEQVGHSIQETGIGLFNGMSPQIHPNALFRILSQIRFGSTLNIAASLASPCRPTHGLRGVFAEPIIGKVSQIMRAIGYQRAMVVHGYDHDGQKGMDEISTLGETVVKEFFPDGRQTSYRITPEELGLDRTTYESIAAKGDVEKEAVRFMQVVGGVDHRECIDLVCANAGAVLYVAGRSKDLSTGVTAGRKLIDSGRAFEKLCQWIRVQSDPEQSGVTKFKQIAARAGLRDDVNRSL
jgi:anthranilate phosphoribosyltransferase